jgi:predicted DNA-binding WGR domain protein
MGWLMGKLRGLLLAFLPLDDREGSLQSIRLVRHWGRIGTTGQEKAEEFANEDEAGRALETLAQAMRRQGYRDL